MVIEASFVKTLLRRTKSLFGMYNEKQWSGSLVVRLLGPSIEPQYDQTRKPKARVSLRPFMTSDPVRSSSHPLEHLSQHPLTATDMSATPDFLQPGSAVSLEVNLIPPEGMDQSPAKLFLSRRSSEDVENCLNRLGINISKKIHSILSTEKKGKKGAKVTRKPSCIALVHGQVDPVRASGISNADFWNSTIHNQTTIVVTVNGIDIPLKVECNPPTVLSVSTFEKFEGLVFPGVPQLIQTEVLFATHAQIDWYADDECVCVDSPLYVPTMDDVNKTLSILIRPMRPGHDGADSQEAYQFVSKVEPALPDNVVLGLRPRWSRKRQDHDIKENLRIMTYNILADQNAFSGPDRAPFFEYVSADILSRSRRMPLILHEILSYEADVICLQEVDQYMFDTLFQPVLEHYHYQGFFSVKQSPGNQEGCAMFWSLDKFQEVPVEQCKTLRLSKLLAQYETLSVSTPPDWKPHVEVVHELFRKRPDLVRVIERLGHILQLVVLRDLDGNPLVISNTHLFFHPNAPHIRVLQLFAIAHEISRTLEERGKGAPFCFCGDLNTSIRYCGRLWTTRETPENHREFREGLNTFQWGGVGTSSSSTRDDNFPKLSLPDSFPDVVSAYPVIPEFTHYVGGFQGTLDHILITPQAHQGQLECVGQAEMPSVEQVTQEIAMPSASFPSDHVALVADLKWLRKTTCND
eukprot:Nitzschia sp. Nitz4//scaffold216_size36101//14825//16897//NITZ4_007778-RA/size36101-processed-gene-0.43-mRNA-1//-1//CDS//3329542185//1995//frame0